MSLSFNYAHPNFKSKAYQALCLFLFFAAQFSLTLNAEPKSDYEAKPKLGESAPIQSTDPIFVRDTLRIQTLVCPFKGQINYQPGEIECGLLEVPENRETPDSRFIELHFVRINAKADLKEQTQEDGTEEKEEAIHRDVKSGNWTKPEPGKRPDPVVYLTGGPGAKVDSYVKRFKDHLLVNHRDLYILEQRGIGTSDDFCRHYSNRNRNALSPSSFEESGQAALEMANSCAKNAQRSGVDLSGYSTIENARDVQALRMALGFEKWNVWGISYGSILGQAYLKQDPEGILAAALDAIMPITARDKALHWSIAKWYDRNLKKLQQACDDHSDCGDNFPGLGQKVRNSITRIQSDPIKLNLKDTEIFPDGKAYVFENIAGYLPFTLMYEQSNYPALPNIIYLWNKALAKAIENPEDEQNLKLFKLVLQGAGTGFGMSQGMNDTILCLDGGKASQAESSRSDLELFPVLASAMSTKEVSQGMATRCNEFGIAPRPAEEYSATVTDIPTLIIEGDMDPITPPPLAEVILPGFKNGTYIEFPYAGHGPSRSVRCAGDMLTLFFDNPNQTPDTSCVDEMKLPEFLSPLYETSFAVNFGLLVMEDKKSVIGPSVWAGLSILISLISFAVLSINAINRRIDKQIRRQGSEARRYVWCASLISILSIGILAAAVATTIKSSQLLIIFGLVSWAWWGGLFALLAGLLALIGVYKTIQTHRGHPLRFGSLVGFIITGLSVVSYSLFILVWDLGPF